MLGLLSVGIGPIGWANDDLRGWGPPMTGDRIMREIAQAGYAGSEMSYTYPQEPNALREALAGHGLVLSAAYRWTNFAYPESWDREISLAMAHLDFCAAAGARFAILAEGSGSLHWDLHGPRAAVRPLVDPDWERVSRAFNKVGAYGRDREVTVCLHPHAGTAIEGAAEIARLLAATDAENLGYCLDTGHATYAGDDPAALISQFGPRIRYLHLKDVRPQVLDRARRENLSFLDAIKLDVFGVPGSGCIAFDRIGAALSNIGYGGWLVVEADQSPTDNEPLQVALAARSLIRQVFGA